MRIRRGDWVKHPKIEQALYVEKIDDTGQAWLRSPAADGFPFPVHFSLPAKELRKIDNPYEPFEEAPW